MSTHRRPIHSLPSGCWWPATRPWARPAPARARVCDLSCFPLHRPECPVEPRGSLWCAELVTSFPPPGISTWVSSSTSDT